MKLILTGATGAAGLEILRTAIADSTVSQITVLSRRALPSSIPPSSKVTHIQHTDFTSYPPELVSRLAGHGACIWALGISSSGMNEGEYTRITHDYPTAALKALDEGGVRGADGTLKFVYFSGHGADAEGKGRLLFARVKGMAEKDLTSYASISPSLNVYNLRPAYFFPSNPIDAAAVRSWGGRASNYIMSPLFNRLAPSLIIKIEDLARFAVEAAKGRVGSENTISNKRMKELLEEWKNGRGNGN